MSKKNPREPPLGQNSKHNQSTNLNRVIEDRGPLAATVLINLNSCIYRQSLCQKVLKNVKMGVLPRKLGNKKRPMQYVTQANI